MITFDGFIYNEMQTSVITQLKQVATNLKDTLAAAGYDGDGGMFRDMIDNVDNIKFVSYSQFVQILGVSNMRYADRIKTIKAWLHSPEAQEVCYYSAGKPEGGNKFFIFDAFEAAGKEGKTLVIGENLS